MSKSPQEIWTSFKTAVLPPRVVWVFFGIIVLSFVLRATYLDFGFPYQWHPDEPMVLNLGIRMLQTGDLNPHRFNYPNFYIYVQAIGAALSWFSYTGSHPLQDPSSIPTGADDKFIWIIGNEFVWYRARAITALFGAVAVGLTYLAGRKLAGERIGIVSALIFAFCPLHIEFSRYVAVDVPTSTASAALLLASAWLLMEGERRHYVQAAVCLGWLIGSKYNAVMGATVPFCAWYLSERRNERFWMAFFLLPIALLVFVATMPYFVLDLSTAFSDMAREVNHYKFAEDIIVPGWPHVWAMTRVWATDILPGWFVLFPIGMVAMAKEDWRKLVLALAMPISYLGYMSTTTVFYDRNMAPTVPALCLVAGWGGVRLYEWLAARFGRLALIVPLLMLLPAGWSIEKSRRFGNLSDPRVAIAAWAQEQPQIILGIPEEFRFVFDIRTLGQVQTRKISLSDGPESWAEAGVTHVLGAPDMSAKGGTDLQVTLTKLDPAQNWFKSHPAVFQPGRGPLVLDRANANTAIGVWKVDGARNVERIKPPPRWRIPPDAKELAVAEGEQLTLTTAGEEQAATICETLGTRMMAGATVSGRYKIQNGPPKNRHGARVIVRFYDVDNRPLPGGIGTGALSLLAEGHENEDWTDFSKDLTLPANAVQAKICVELRWPGASFTVDGATWANLH